MIAPFSKQSQLCKDTQDTMAKIGLYLCRIEFWDNPNLESKDWKELAQLIHQFNEQIKRVINEGNSL